jgi:hypothetical protein
MARRQDEEEPVTYQQDLGTRNQPAGWTGWIMFAAALLMVSGLIGIVEGLTGIFRDAAFFADGTLVVFDYTAWGWIHLIIGILLLVIGTALWRGSQAARVIAIVLVILHLLANFTWLSTNFPWWSLIAIAINLLVLYALIVHGDEAMRARGR